MALARAALGGRGDRAGRGGGGGLGGGGLGAEERLSDVRLGGPGSLSRLRDFRNFLLRAVFQARTWLRSSGSGVGGDGGESGDEADGGEGGVVGCGVGEWAGAGGGEQE